MSSNLSHYEEKLSVAYFANDLLSMDHVVIWDSETTGLNDDARFVEIAAIDLAGSVLLNTRIDPQIPIPPDATRIHGITDAMVVSVAPTIRELWPELHSVLNDRVWLIYNAEYDTARLWANEYRLFGNRRTLAHSSREFCAMHLYATFYGELHLHYGNYTWQKLTRAAEQCGVEVDAPAHSALGDCLRTLGVIRAMASWFNRQVNEYGVKIS